MSSNLRQGVPWFVCDIAISEYIVCCFYIPVSCPVSRSMINLIFPPDPKTKYSANVLFVMDSSRETASTYNTAKDLIKSLARYLNINQEGARAALLVFNGRPSIISDFESFRSASDFESTVDRVPHYGGGRSVSDALQTAAGMFPKSPSSVSKVVFLVTSGKPLQKDDGSSVGDVIDKLSALGVRTYVALIGPSPNIQEFTSNVENPENVFAVASRSDIPKKIKQVGSQVLSDSGKLNSSCIEWVRPKKCLSSITNAALIH